MLHMGGYETSSPLTPPNINVKEDIKQGAKFTEKYYIGNRVLPCHTKDEDKKENVLINKRVLLYKTE